MQDSLKSSSYQQLEQKSKYTNISTCTSVSVHLSICDSFHSCVCPKLAPIPAVVSKKVTT